MGEDGSELPCIIFIFTDVLIHMTISAALGRPIKRPSGHSSHGIGQLEAGDRRFGSKGGNGHRRIPQQREKQRSSRATGGMPAEGVLPSFFMSFIAFGFEINLRDV